MGHNDEAPMVCEHCGTAAAPIKRKPGHTAVSVVILLFALIALAAMPVAGVRSSLWDGSSTGSIGWQQRSWFVRPADAMTPGFRPTLHEARKW